MLSVCQMIKWHTFNFYQFQYYLLFPQFRGNSQYEEHNKEPHYLYSFGMCYFGDDIKKNRSSGTCDTCERRKMCELFCGES